MVRQILKRLPLGFSVLAIALSSSVAYCENEQTNDEPKYEISMFLLKEPIWAAALKKADWILEGKKADGKRIGFLSFADQSIKGAKSGSAQETHTGRLTRSIPLFMAESFYCRTNAQAFTFIPTIMGQGPVLTQSEWNHDLIMRISDIGEEQKMDFIVAGAIDKPNENSYLLKIRVWDIANQTISKTFEYESKTDLLGDSVIKANNDLLRYFTSISALKVQPALSFYKSQDQTTIAQYLMIHGQLLALSLVASEVMSKEDVWGKRDIMNNSWDLVAKEIDREMPKILFLAELSRMKKIDINVVNEFKYKAISLTAEKKDSAISKLAPLIYHIYDMKNEFEKSKLKLKVGANEKYIAWLIAIDKPAKAGDDKRE